MIGVTNWEKMLNTFQAFLGGVPLGLDEASVKEIEAQNKAKVDEIRAEHIRQTKEKKDKEQETERRRQEHRNRTNPLLATLNAEKSQLDVQI